LADLFHAPEASDLFSFRFVRAQGAEPSRPVLTLSAAVPFEPGKPRRCRGLKADRPPLIVFCLLTSAAADRLSLSQEAGTTDIADCTDQQNFRFEHPFTRWVNRSSKGHRRREPLWSSHLSVRIRVIRGVFGIRIWAESLARPPGSGAHVLHPVDPGNPVRETATADAGFRMRRLRRGARLEGAHPESRRWIQQEQRRERRMKKLFDLGRSTGPRRGGISCSPCPKGTVAARSESSPYPRRQHRRHGCGSLGVPSCGGATSACRATWGRQPIRVTPFTGIVERVVAGSAVLRQAQNRSTRRRVRQAHRKQAQDGDVFPFGRGGVVERGRISALGSQGGDGCRRRRQARGDGSARKAWGRAAGDDFGLVARAKRLRRRAPLSGAGGRNWGLDFSRGIPLVPRLALRPSSSSG